MLLKKGMRPIKRVVMPIDQLDGSRIKRQQTQMKYIKKLEDANRELQAAFAFSHDGIFISDKEGLGLRWNESYCRITGIHSEYLKGVHPQQLFEQKFISESATLNAIQSRKVETTMPVLKSGKQVMITSIPVFDQAGDIFRVVANIRDMSELMELKKQIEQVRELSDRYYSEVLHLRNRDVVLKGMTAESPSMKKVIATALKVAKSEVTILITGESGTGKEVLARSIHEHSEVGSGPFVKVNCGAIPENLLESELFGYEKGAFTSAAQTGKMGILEIAMGGTLFLDEIGEMPLVLQAKLLGVLQDKKFTRLGGVKEKDLNARIIAATNRDLEEMIKEKKFRKDLFYRLNVVGLKIPPLSERKDDIFPFANFFLHKFNKKYKSATSLSPQVINTFMNYEWPGNVREMENLLERLVVLAPDERITLEMLPDEMLSSLTAEYATEKAVSLGTGQGLVTLLHSVERRIFETLLADGYSSYKMASLLGVNQSTVVRKIKKLGLKLP
nr:sigma 54-interacting transcriptional regulator [uncultured Anaeromusa sp.]